MKRALCMEDDIPHVVSFVKCGVCGNEWLAMRPVITAVNMLECPECGARGNTVETGRQLEMEDVE